MEELLRDKCLDSSARGGSKDGYAIRHPAVPGPGCSSSTPTGSSRDTPRRLVTAGTSYRLAGARKAPAHALHTPRRRSIRIRPVPRLLERPADPGVVEERIAGEAGQHADVTLLGLRGAVHQGRHLHRARTLRREVARLVRSAGGRLAPGIGHPFPGLEGEQPPVVVDRRRGGAGGEGHVRRGRDARGRGGQHEVGSQPRSTSRHPMSRRNCFPSNATRSAASRLNRCASAIECATAVTASTRPPDVTSRPSRIAVPA